MADPACAIVVAAITRTRSSSKRPTKGHSRLTGGVEPRHRSGDLTVDPFCARPLPGATLKEVARPWRWRRRRRRRRWRRRRRIRPGKTINVAVPDRDRVEDVADTHVPSQIRKRQLFPRAPIVLADVPVHPLRLLYRCGQGLALAWAPGTVRDRPRRRLGDASAQPQTGQTQTAGQHQSRCQPCASVFHRPRSRDPFHGCFPLSLVSARSAARTGRSTHRA